MLLTAEQISKNYGMKPLLTEVSLYLEAGDKVGILGINGTGKSTLLRILAGREEPDSGTVTRVGDARVSYLEQDPPMRTENSLLEQIREDLADDGQQREEYEAAALLNRLGFPDPSVKIGALSGGQRKRVALTSALLRPADILILDEPTNHLDIDMINRLEDTLKRFPGGLVMVTHDRYFLNRAVNKIIELERGSFYTYEANYSKYLALKSQRAEMAQASFRKRQAFLKKEFEWLSRGARARSTKSRDRIERYEALKAEAAPETDGRVEITSAASRLGRKILELEKVSKRFGDRLVTDCFSYGILKDDRIGIVGKNGAGKSTLLDLIAGTLLPDSGTVTRGATVRIGYFTQNSGSLPDNEKVIDYINGIAREIRTAQGTLTASHMLERFLFSGEMQHTPIGRLSGGEKRRLYLLGILMSSPNVLLLDEPTNDLDVETLGILEEYLSDFPGPILAVSHDRYFLDKIAETVFEIGVNGKITRYTGNYSAFEAKRPPDLPSPAAPVTEKKGQRPERQKKLRFTYKEEQEFKGIDREIAELEEKLARCEAEMKEAAADYVRLSQLTADREAMESALAEKMERWVALNDLAERIRQQEG